MAGAAVPAAGAIGDDDVTNAEQETNLENLAEAVRRMPGVGEASIAFTPISAGSIAPTKGIVIVDTEGFAAADNLDWIDPGAYIQNSVVVVTGGNPPSRVVTIRNAQGGTGQFALVGGGNFALSDTTAWIAFRLVSTVWVEIHRSYGTDFAGFRSRIGLGSVATLDDGDVDAATLEGNPASAFLPVAGTAANSTLFAGLAAAAFLRADLASLQTIAGSLRAASGRLEAATASAAGSPILSFLANAIERGQFYYEGTTGFAYWILKNAGGTNVGGIRLRPNLPPDWWDGSSWVPLFTVPSPSPWLDRVRWDKLDATTQYSGTGRTVLHAADAPVLPGSGATRIYRIQAGILGGKVGSTNPSFTTRIYVGDNGDDTDTLVAEGPATSVDSPLTPESSLIDDEFEVPAGDFITLVLNKTNSANLDVFPSVAGTYNVTKQTYLRAEQIG